MELEGKLVFRHAGSGKKIDLPPEGEDLLIAVLLNLIRDAMVLEAEYVFEDAFDDDIIE